MKVVVLLLNKAAEHDDASPVSETKQALTTPKLAEEKLRHRSAHRQPAVDCPKGPPAGDGTGDWVSVWDIVAD